VYQTLNIIFSVVVTSCHTQVTMLRGEEKNYVVISVHCVTSRIIGN
jgi:hypothetical protein